MMSLFSCSVTVNEVAKFTKKGITYAQQIDFIFFLSSAKVSSSYPENDKQQLRFL